VKTDRLLVDTNVILDLVADEAEWADWSQSRLHALSASHRLIINPVVYAELSIGYRRIEDLERALASIPVAMEEIPRDALFLAGKAFIRYRAQGGTRTGVLPDFFIGAHAAVLDTPLVTRDPRRYRTYFPGVQLVTPFD
jgi:predicted nucleic acid-binding protein